MQKHVYFSFCWDSTIPAVSYFRELIRVGESFAELLSCVCHTSINENSIANFFTLFCLWWGILLVVIFTKTVAQHTQSNFDGHLETIKGSQKSLCGRSCNFSNMADTHMGGFPDNPIADSFRISLMIEKRGIIPFRKMGHSMLWQFYAYFKVQSLVGICLHRMLPRRHFGHVPAIANVQRHNIIFDCCYSNQPLFKTTNWKGNQSGYFKSFCKIWWFPILMYFKIVDCIIVQQNYLNGAELCRKILSFVLEAMVQCSMLNGPCAWLPPHLIPQIL